MVSPKDEHLEVCKVSKLRRDGACKQKSNTHLAGNKNDMPGFEVYDTYIPIAKTAIFCTISSIFRDLDPPGHIFHDKPRK